MCLCHKTPLFHVEKWAEMPGKVKAELEEMVMRELRGRPSGLLKEKSLGLGKGLNDS